MIFWASSEAYRPVGAASEKVRRCIEPFLNSAFAATSLATLKGKLRYVPIIMPEGMRENYPARSRLLKKERIYDCAPQLDYDIFIKGSYEDHLREYLRGISLAAPHLSGLGATKEQLADFEGIMISAVDLLLADQPFVKYHAWNPKDSTKKKRKLNAAQKRELKATEFRLFVREYGSRAQKGQEPNDRGYNREIEKKIKAMQPEKLDELLRDGDDEE